MNLFVNFHVIICPSNLTAIRMRALGMKIQKKKQRKLKMKKWVSRHFVQSSHINGRLFST